MERKIDMNKNQHLLFIKQKGNMKQKFLLAGALMFFVSALATQAQNVNLDKSTFTWTGKKVAGEHTGNIKLKSGSIKIDGKELKGGNFIIDMTTLTCTDLKDEGTNTSLINHLKSDDFFSVDKFKESRFNITKVVRQANNQYQVTGNLEIKGTNHPNTIKATFEEKGKQKIFTGTMVVDRTLYNIRYGSGKFFENLGDRMINDEFEIKFSLVVE